MPITWRADVREWHLANGHTSWVLGVLDNGWIGQLHAGAPLAVGPSYRHLAALPFHGFDNRVGEPIGLVLPVPDVGDYRAPALAVELGDGSRTLDLRYRGHRISPGKPPLPRPLPSSYVEADEDADTLEIDVGDESSGLVVTLAYSLFADSPVVARSMRVHNGGQGPVTMRTAMSLSLDLPDDAWTLLQLSGTWARERHVVERELVPGLQGIGSTRGGSSHQQNPFLALRRAATTEARGEAWGVTLAWSGSFAADVDVEPHGTARLRIGVNPDGFAWRLEPGETFTTPEALIAWSDEGLGGLSHALHATLCERVARGRWRDEDRPILLNNWEGTYFDFDHARLVAMAAQAKAMGVELFVLDDGWFGARDDDHRSLGDWVVNHRKLPDGLAGLAQDVRALGLRFGLWIEPEAVNADSDLFRAHPDWALGVPGRHRTESRYQYVLDMANPAVVDHLEAVFVDVLSSAPIDYVKWDWNRPITEPYSPALPAGRQGEVSHRYVLGTYELWARLTTRFPDILFESCAGGGGRFDAGMLAYAPQAWTSDDTDAVERLKVQWGTSLAYPLSAMAAHVSAVPNHQTGRVAPLDFRAAVAMFGSFGYELDPTAMTDDERAAVARQVAFYAARRDLFQRGRLVRLRSPFGGDGGDGNETAWMILAPDGSRGVLAHYRVLSRPMPDRNRLLLRGLEPGARYELTAWYGFERPEPAIIRGGDELMALGLGIEPPDPLPAVRPPWDFDGTRLVRHDFEARLFDIRRL